MLLIIVLAVLYGWNDPASNSLFPGCPVKKYTGLDCPGCGSQRAVHNLLNLNIGKAFMNNPLLVLSIPYILGGWYLDFKGRLSRRELVWRRRLYGVRAIYIVLTVIVVFTVVRNII